jgi:hypothetical protein
VAACCFMDDHCEEIGQADCAAQGANWQPTAVCADMPCGPHDFTVNRTGDIANSIDNLEVDGLVYNVQFVHGLGQEVFPDAPLDFDFADIGAAGAAADAVSFALNTVEIVTLVGSSGVTSDTFYIPYDEDPDIFAVESGTYLAPDWVDVAGDVITDKTPEMFAIFNVVTGNGACCVGTTCSIETPAECKSLGGDYQGDGTSCSGDPCGGGGPDCPGEGACNEANGTPGCEDEACCNAVCTIDPFCCEVEWDAECVSDAADACDSGNPVCPGEGSCFEDHPGLGCEDEDCCIVVCVCIINYTM